jgi:hypothetical protein
VSTELRDLIEYVGEDRFRKASEWAWATAPGTGTAKAAADDGWPKSATMVPHDLEELIWDDEDASWKDRVDLALALYREMPCYAILMYARHHFFEWDEPARTLFWREARKLLADRDDRLADPIAYSLWCDYFEDGDPVEEAWYEVAERDPPSERRLQRVLAVSGPVPFELKMKLYERLLPEKRWHPWIFTSLFNSAFDIYGQLDAKPARKVLVRLQVPADRSEELDALWKWFGE